MNIYGQVGPQILGDGSTAQLRQGKSGETSTADVHGRFFEPNYRGTIFSTGMQLTSISNATFTTADALSGTLGTAATTTPIIGLWNPLQNSVNCVILQAQLGVIITALAATGCGGFAWVGYSGNAAITVASQAVPVNRKTLLASGSNAKGLCGLALTGLIATGNLLGASSLGGGSLSNASFTATAAAMQTPQMSYVENLDGGIIVPPGGILALVCSTTPVAHSAVAGLVWEEVAI